MRIAIIIFCILIGVCVTAYFYWITSPLYAFQEAAFALKDHDSVKFEKYVAADELVDHLLEDLLVQPALSTPGLSTLQVSVAGGALAMAKTSIARGLLQSLKQQLSYEREQWSPISYLPFFGIAAAQAQISSNGAGLKDFWHAASKEMSGEVTKQRTVAYNRMIYYIQNHPNTVPGRVLDCPASQRTAHVQAMLQDYGLSLNNFKGLSGCNTASDIIGRQSATARFNFFSAKISSLIVLEVALKKDLSTGTWRIDRLSNIKAVMDQVEPYYDRDLHELVEYALAGMNNNNMARDMKGMTERLKQSPAAQNFLQKLNLR